ncbi:MULTISPECIES: penicillin-binding protein 2 [unclassified Novosphingobium]|uniref:peptidoglycan D,D-transpeptidase FtsI family protein n=1 Tax=unclassified Novosphingobium TaxID=2644732 RepID=UPI0025D657AA|nr:MULTISPECIES: penicillin-binding protein 2 [unclassified Novosphingobium]HQV03368.1 penicillin-binding protein 2 [Novosphingobium sp.]
MTTIAVSTTISSGRGALVNVRSRSLLMAKWRVLWVVLGFSVIALAAVSRILFLGLFEPAPAQQQFGTLLVPERADIVDRNGVPLARAFPAYALWYNPAALGGDGPPLVRSPREVAESLSRIFPDLEVNALAARLAEGRPGYLRRRILPEDANRVHQMGEPALEFPRETERFYPQGSMAAHVLGFVGADGHGHVGMEQVFDDRLTDPAQRGTPAMLSIDARVQGALEDELMRGMNASNAKGAAGIVLDVDTGEVVALASLPSFNPNLIDRAGESFIFNRVTNQVYELGSTFKPITVAAAIDAGSVTDLARRYQSSRPIAIGGFQIKDSHALGASLNVPEALIHSSNIVTAQIADEVGPERLNQTMRDLGMDQRAQIELPARGFPLWPKGQWSRITTMTVSYGHGIAVTPLHLASAYAALVNGGIWRPATLVKVEPGQAVPGRRVFKASTSARMRQLLRMIVDIGTGRNADAVGYRVGGKTGSAEKPGAGGYRKSSLVATFAAAFPMDHPRYVVIAMLDEPQGTAATSGQRTAAWNAAPVVGRLVPRIGPLLGIMPDATRDVDITDLAPLVGKGEGE